MMISSLAAISLFAAGALAEVKVTTAPAPEGGIVYTYHLKNTAPLPIVGFSVGLKDENLTDSANGEPQLTGLPVGYPETSAITAPAEWSGAVVTREESEHHYIEWQSPKGLAPAAMLDTFSVRLATPDDAYQNGWYHVILSTSVEGSGPLSTGGSRTTQWPIVAVAGAVVLFIIVFVARSRKKP